MRLLSTAVLSLLSAATIPLATHGTRSLAPAAEPCAPEVTSTATWEHLALRMQWTEAEPLLHQLLLRSSPEDHAVRAVLLHRLSVVNLELGRDTWRILEQQAHESVWAWHDDPTGCEPAAFEALEAEVGPRPPPTRPRPMDYEECVALAAMGYGNFRCEPPGLLDRMRGTGSYELVDRSRSLGWWMELRRLL